MEIRRLWCDGQASSRLSILWSSVFAVVALVAAATATPAERMADAPSAQAGDRSRSVRVLNDDGGWCWFQDERALVVGRMLLFGSVASGRTQDGRRGAVEATWVDLDGGPVSRIRLDATSIEDGPVYDDHDAPAFVLREDGRVLAAWTGHGTRNAFFTRILEPGGKTPGPEREFSPSPTSRLTYNNLHHIPGTKTILNFFRGKDDRAKPSLAVSRDDGESWTAGPIVVEVPAAVWHRPYVKYTSDGVGGVHLIYSEGHPRDFDNSLYHVIVRDESILNSRGVALRRLEDGLPSPETGTRVFAGDPGNVAWPQDLEVDEGGEPIVAFSVQKDSAGLPRGEGGSDHRYWLGRWRGGDWRAHEIAFAGSRLYLGEDDYTGGMALTPGDPSVLYLSTNADPVSGKPLVSARDGKRHWEIYRGTSVDQGRSWEFQALTRDSTLDNIRPLVPGGSRGHGIVLWLRGTYRAYTDYELEVVGLGL